MARLAEIGVNLITLECFRQFPVWAWSGSMDYYQPVVDFTTLPDDLGNLFIKATFVTPDCQQFDGEISLTGLHEAYAANLLIDDQSFDLDDMFEKELSRLRQYLGQPDLQLFPLEYHTEFHTADGEPIKGIIPSAVDSVNNQYFEQMDS